ncbi:hypothetical protein N7457_003207 [Penicillium paradoxum]|uniref:uncharacterized protein n=1 Tax=Penicillium paradoxum TaxID=176176 RepID=UPI00254664CA|nr:uncharacterized protein N7457_003207 [Penicillium paradoxum]KAJ5788217.1 hypothetical protein N7457_003207 [Penicillium paradoxum]
MLKEMETLVRGPSAERIKGILQKYNSGSSDALDGNPRPHHTSNVQGQGWPERSSSSSSIGSLEAVDRVEDDLNLTESSRATGYMGKSSEVTWMRRVEEEAEQRSRGQPPNFTSSDKDSSTRIAPHVINYHLDDLGIDAPGPVQMYWVPPRLLADHLLETYLRMVHPHFPIINRTMFSSQYRAFFSDMSYADSKWLAILNLVFAIATNYSYNSDATQRRDTQDHLFYLTRARMLSMSGDNIFQHPDIQQVQIEGLIAFHMLSTNQINRAWRISALAIRSAVSLGINTKTSTCKISAVSKEVRCRIWWCLFAIEHKLGSMTGRGTSISIHMSTTHLPLPFDEDQFSDPSAAELLNDYGLREKCLNMAMTSPHLRHTDSPQTDDTLTEAGHAWLRGLPVNSSIYFLYYSDLIVVNQEILDRIYSAESASVSWEDVKGRINQLKTSIDTWKSTLPPGLNFSTMKDENDQTYWAKTNLAFHYYSIRIILGRPCLCRHRTHQQKADREGFSHDMAVMTLESAMHMLDLLPSEPNTAHVYQFCPWWCFLHYIMQTATVIILELSFDCFHMPDRRGSLLQSAKKSVMWLHTMSEHCIASHRAWQLCENALRRLMYTMGYDASDTQQFPNPGRDSLFADPPGLMLPTYTDGSMTGAQFLPHNGIPQSSVPAYGTHDASPYTNTTASEALFVQTEPVLPAGDTYIPHDPISDEFIRYFFPGLDGEETHRGDDNKF